MTKAKNMIIVLLCIILAGCAYKRHNQQGNLIKEEKLAQLTPGMTKRQVADVMGSPVLKNTFDKSRWHYVYRYQRGKTVQAQKRVIVVFKRDKLADVLVD